MPKRLLTEVTMETINSGPIEGPYIAVGFAFGEQPDDPAEIPQTRWTTGFHAQAGMTANEVADMLEQFANVLRVRHGEVQPSASAE